MIDRSDEEIPVIELEESPAPVKKNRHSAFLERRVRNEDAIWAFWALPDSDSLVNEKIPQETEWVAEYPKSKYWEKLKQRTSLSQQRNNNQELLDATTFLHNMELKQLLQTNYDSYYDSGYIQKMIVTSIILEVTEEMCQSVCLELFRVIQQASNTCISSFLPGIMTINERTQRYYLATGRISLIAGCLQDGMMESHSMPYRFRYEGTVPTITTKKPQSFLSSITITNLTTLAAVDDQPYPEMNKFDALSRTTMPELPLHHSPTLDPGTFYQTKLSITTLAYNTMFVPSNPMIWPKERMQLYGMITCLQILPSILYDKAGNGWYYIFVGTSLGRILVWRWIASLSEGNQEDNEEEMKTGMMLVGQNDISTSSNHRYPIQSLAFCRDTIPTTHNTVQQYGKKGKRKRKKSHLDRVVSMNHHQLMTIWNVQTIFNQMYTTTKQQSNLHNKYNNRRDHDNESDSEEEKEKMINTPYKPPPSAGTTGMMRYFQCWKHSSTKTTDAATSKTGAKIGKNKNKNESTVARIEWMIPEFDFTTQEDIQWNIHRPLDNILPFPSSASSSLSSENKKIKEVSLWSSYFSKNSNNSSSSNSNSNKKKNNLKNWEFIPRTITCLAYVPFCNQLGIHPSIIVGTSDGLIVKFNIDVFIPSFNASFPTVNEEEEEDEDEEVEGNYVEEESKDKGKSRKKGKKQRSASTALEEESSPANNNKSTSQNNTKNESRKFMLTTREQEAVVTTKPMKEVSSSPDKQQQRHKIRIVHTKSFTNMTDRRYNFITTEYNAPKEMTKDGVLLLHAPGQDASKPNEMPFNGNQVFRELFVFHQAKIVLLEFVSVSINMMNRFHSATTSTTQDDVPYRKQQDSTSSSFRLPNDQILLSMDEDGYVAYWQYSSYYFQGVSWFEPWKVLHLALEVNEWVPLIDANMNITQQTPLQQEQKMLFGEEIVFPPEEIMPKLKLQYIEDCRVPIVIPSSDHNSTAEKEPSSKPLQFEEKKLYRYFPMEVDFMETKKQKDKHIMIQYTVTKPKTPLPAQYNPLRTRGKGLTTGGGGGRDVMKQQWYQQLGQKKNFALQIEQVLLSPDQVDIIVVMTKKPLTVEEETAVQEEEEEEQNDDADDANDNDEEKEKKAKQMKNKKKKKKAQSPKHKGKSEAMNPDVVYIATILLQEMICYAPYISVKLHDKNHGGVGATTNKMETIEQFQDCIVGSIHQYTFHRFVWILTTTSLRVFIQSTGQEIELSTSTAATATAAADASPSSSWEIIQKDIQTHGYNKLLLSPQQEYLILYHTDKQQGKGSSSSSSGGGGVPSIYEIVWFDEAQQKLILFHESQQQQTSSSSTSSPTPTALYRDAQFLTTYARKPIFQSDHPNHVLLQQTRGSETAAAVAAAVKLSDQDTNNRHPKEVKLILNEIITEIEDFEKLAKVRKQYLNDVYEGHLGFVPPVDWPVATPQNKSKRDKEKLNIRIEDILANDYEKYSTTLSHVDPHHTLF